MEATTVQGMFRAEDLRGFPCVNLGVSCCFKALLNPISLKTVVSSLPCIFTCIFFLFRWVSPSLQPLQCHQTRTQPGQSMQTREKKKSLCEDSIYIRFQLVPVRVCGRWNEGDCNPALQKTKSHQSASSFEVYVTGAQGFHHVTAQQLCESSAAANHKRCPEPSLSDVQGWAPGSSHFLGCEEEPRVGAQVWCFPSVGKQPGSSSRAGKDLRAGSWGRKVDGCPTSGIFPAFQQDREHEGSTAFKQRAHHHAAQRHVDDPNQIQVSHSWKNQQVAALWD